MIKIILTDVVERRREMDVKCYDTGPDSGMGRYTIIFPDGDARSMSEDPLHPLGVGLWISPREYDEDCIGEEVPFDSLPEQVQRAVKMDWEEWYDK